MGTESDAGAVVDPHCRVYGIEGLRVIDASVMPSLIGGNINAAVMMIAERTSDLIRGQPVLAPEHPGRVTATQSDRPQPQTA